VSRLARWPSVSPYTVLQHHHNPRPCRHPHQSHNKRHYQHLLRRGQRPGQRPSQPPWRPRSPPVLLTSYLKTLVLSISYLHPPRGLQQDLPQGPALESPWVLIKLPVINQLGLALRWGPRKVLPQSLLGLVSQWAFTRAQSTGAVR
jgi:hypothetical protein